MRILVVGLNHKSAPIGIREKLAFDTEETAKALMQLKKKFGHSEFVLLSTCNRVELYIACSYAEEIDLRAIAEFLSDFHNIPLNDFQDYLYIYSDAEAVRHLLMVSSSLDSMVVGETQILGQVKEGYRYACQAKSTGKILNRLFHCSFATSKKIYTDTSVSSGRVSVAGVAVELAMQLFSDISSSKVVIIGAGEMGELLVEHLLHGGCKTITVVNRSYDHGINIANQYGIEARKWEELHKIIVDVDIIIASAASRGYLFEKKAFEEMIHHCRKRPLLIIDVAVPRNFDPAISKVENIYLYSIDELASVAEQNRKAREEDVAKGLQIVNENVVNFMNWFRTRDIGPLIGEMREKVSQSYQQEFESLFVGTMGNALCKEARQAIATRIINSLLHFIIKNINLIAKENGTAEAQKLVDSIVRQTKEVLYESNAKRKS